MLEKTGDSQCIIDTIRLLHDGLTVQETPAAEGKPVLTGKEYQVLQLIAQGHPNRVIAEHLFISPKTVDSHRQHIMQKLDVHSTAELIKTALQQGLIV